MAITATDRIYWATDTTLQGAIPVPEGYEPGDLLEFAIGEDYRQPPLRLWLDSEITRVTSDGQLTWAVFFPAGEIVALFPPEERKTLRWQLRIGGANGQPVQGQVILLPAYDDQTAPPPIPPPDFYLKSTNSPRLVQINGLAVAPGEAIGFAPDGSITTLPVSGAPNLSGPAGEPLSALRVVVEEGGELVYADLIPTHASRALGFLSAATAQGDTATAATFGEFSDPGWAWDPDLPIWLGAAGTLTQSPPTVSHLRVVAAPISPTAILFEPQSPILL